MADVRDRSGGSDINAQEVKAEDVVGRDKNVYYGAVPAVTHHNSLPNQPYFFGRKDELEKIANALDPEAQGWGVLISGPGGIGKTALAIRAGHLASDEDYPIKVFLSAKVIQLTPQGVEDLQDFMLPNYMTLLAELARELGDENIAKIDPNLRANEVRRLLADKDALIIIDNLETFDEKTERPRVFQFLSRLPRSCKAIVTSRRRIDVPAEIIRLDRLKQEDALELIAKLATRNKYLAKATEQERLSVYETTRGNPLLIEWIAGQLGNSKSRCRTIADAIQFLGNTPKDNDPLEFAFGDLLDTFTEHETAVLAALTYFTQPAAVKWIAEIAEITTLQAETALEDLADRSVLVVENAFYLLPALTAAYLRRAQPEVTRQVGIRLLRQAYALASANGFRNYERFSVLEAEWPTIVAAIPHFRDVSGDRLVDLCDALEFFLEFTGRWDERVELDKLAELLAAEAGDDTAAGWRAYKAGWIYYLRGQVEELTECVNRVKKHWAKAYAYERAYAVRLRGLEHELREEYQNAKTCYEQAIDMWQVLGSQTNEISLGLNDLARCKRLLSDYQGAEQDYRRALRYARPSDAIASITGSLAGVCLDQGAWAEAEQLAKEALPLSKGAGRQELVAADCYYLAKALARQGRKAEGLPYAQRAVAIFAKLRSSELAKAQTVLKECEEGDATDSNG